MMIQRFGMKDRPERVATTLRLIAWRSRRRLAMEQYRLSDSEASSLSARSELSEPASPSGTSVGSVGDSAASLALGKGRDQLIE